MSTSSINIRLDNNLKCDSEKLFSELGLNMTTAITMFLRQAVCDQAIPFRICKYPRPNAITLAAMREAEQLAHDPNAKSYQNVDELFEELHS